MKGISVTGDSILDGCVACGSYISIMLSDTHCPVCGACLSDPFNNDKAIDGWLVYRRKAGESK